MEIKYDLTDKYFTYYSEGNGAYLIKKQLLKGKKKKIYGYLKMNLFWYLFNLFISFFFCTIYYLTMLSWLFYIYLFFIGLSTLFLLNIFTFFIIGKTKFNNKKGTIILNENGITDKSSQGNSISFPWSNLQLVTITKHTITFIFDSPVIILIKKEEKEKIIQNIKKYAKVLIIDQEN